MIEVLLIIASLNYERPMPDMETCLSEQVRIQKEYGRQAICVKQDGFYQQDRLTKTRKVVF